MVTIAIIILLIITDPKLAIMVNLSLGVAYGITYYLTRNYLNKIGSQS